MTRLLDEVRLARIAEQDRILALHCDDGSGHCARCARVGLRYDRSPARWPCGAREVAARVRDGLVLSAVPRQRRGPTPV